MNQSSSSQINQNWWWVMWTFKYETKSVLIPKAVYRHNNPPTSNASSTRSNKQSKAIQQVHWNKYGAEKLNRTGYLFCQKAAPLGKKIIHTRWTHLLLKRKWRFKEKKKCIQATPQYISPLSLLNKLIWLDWCQCQLEMSWSWNGAALCGNCKNHLQNPLTTFPILRETR